jgi:uncharacterized protein (TIGR03437 family)
MDLQIVPAAPAVFTYAAGTGQIVAVNQDYSYNGSSKPAAGGEWVFLYLTGQGATSPGIADLVAPTYPYPATAGDFSVKVGGVKVPPGDVWNGLVYQGVLQINFKVPTGLPAGDTVVQISVGDATSQVATIALK